MFFFSNNCNLIDTRLNKKVILFSVDFIFRMITCAVVAVRRVVSII